MKIPAGPQNADLDPATMEMVRKFLHKLPEREQQILKMRHGIDGPQHTLAQIGESLGVSRERIRQLLLRCLRKIKRHDRISKNETGTNGGREEGNSK